MQRNNSLLMVLPVIIFLAFSIGPDTVFVLNNLWVRHIWYPNNVSLQCSKASKQNRRALCIYWVVSYQICVDPWTGWGICLSTLAQLPFLA